jgi:hypothetical protein
MRETDITMNNQDIIKIIEERSILERSEKSIKDMDPYSRVLLSAALNNNIFSVDFTKRLVENDILTFTFRKPSKLPYIVDGMVTIEAYVYMDDEEYTFTILESAENNKDYTFLTETELVSILEELKLLK